MTHEVFSVRQSHAGMFLERLDFYTVWGFTMARLGGGAHSAAWAQMFADALDMPIGEPAGEEMGT
jgi:hypothetical protein